MRAIIAVGMLVTALVGRGWTPEEIARIDKLDIGAHFSRSESAGDGCNTCTWDYVKTGLDTVRMSGWGQCTLLSCSTRFPEERYKPEEKK